MSVIGDKQLFLTLIYFFRYVTMANTEESKNGPRTANSREQDYSDTRMYEEVNSDIDPVAAYEFYLTKLVPDCDILFPYQ